MNKNKLLSVIGLISIIVLISSGIFLLLFMATHGNGSPLPASLRPLMLALTIATFVLGLTGNIVVIIKNRGKTSVTPEYLKRMERNRKLPYCDIADYSAELEAVRASFAAEENKQGNAFPIFKNAATAPHSDFSVLNSGKIYYGFLVEANEELFNTSGLVRCLPAVVVYSPDEYYEKNPEELGKIARDQFENKENNILKDETHYFSNLPIENELTEGRTVYMSTFFVSSAQFPLNFISAPLFPVIADPENCTSVFAVDSKYWTDKLIGNYLFSRTLKKRVEANVKKYAHIKYCDIQDFRAERNYIWDRVYEDNVVENLCKRGEEDLFDGLDDKPNPKICYGCVIATDDGWQRDKEMKEVYLPVIIVYGSDPEYVSSPTTLLNDASLWLSGVNKKEFFKQFNGQHTTVKLAPEATGGRLAYFAAIYINRLWLPEGKLTSLLLPVLAYSNAPENVSFIPAHYWSENFIGYFKGKEGQKSD